MVLNSAASALARETNGAGVNSDMNELQRSLEIDRNPKAGDMVALRELPVGFLDDLSDEDQRAISAIVGQPILLSGYDEDGRAELKFTDPAGVIHFIFVQPHLIALAS